MRLLPGHIYFSSIEPTSSVRLHLCHRWLWMWWPTEVAMHRVPLAHVMIGCGLDHWHRCRCCQPYSTNHHSACKISVGFWSIGVLFSVCVCIWLVQAYSDFTESQRIEFCDVVIDDRRCNLLNRNHLIVHIQH